MLCRRFPTRTTNAAAAGALLLMGQIVSSTSAPKAATMGSTAAAAASASAAAAAPAAAKTTPTTTKPPLVTPYGNPLPSVVHLTVSSSSSSSSLSASATATAKPRTGRCIVVGDVHGCARELRMLLDKVKFEEGADRLIFVGDLVGKGPEPRQVLRLARRLGATAVRGNHDDAAVAAHREAVALGEAPPEKHAWVAARRSGDGDGGGDGGNGASNNNTASNNSNTATCSAAAAVVVDPDDPDIAYLSTLPFSASFPEAGLLVVHAGVVPGPDGFGGHADSASHAGAQQQQQQQHHHHHQHHHQHSHHLSDLKALYKMRDLVRRADGSGGYDWHEKSDDPSAAPWARVWRGPAHVVFGHDAKRRLQLEQAATGLDTGCVYGGELSAAVLPSLRELEEREAARRGRLVSRGSGAAAAAAAAPTLEEMGGRIVSVRALKAYCEKEKKGKKDENGGEDGKGEEEEGEKKKKEKKKDKEKKKEKNKNKQ